MPTKSRSAADPDLNTIARRLTQVKWLTPLDDFELQRAHDLQADPNLAKHQLNLMPDFKTFAIRLYLGGAQRTVGFFREKDITPALRYVDMVKMYFWKYKVRGAHEPTDLELHFSADRAKQDLIHEVEAARLIKDIEQYLFRIGALISSEEKERALREGRAQKSYTRTISGSIQQMSDMWQQEFQNLRKEVECVNSKLDQLLFSRPALAVGPGTGVLPTLTTPDKLPLHPYIGDPPPGTTPYIGDPMPGTPSPAPYVGDPLPGTPGTAPYVGDPTPGITTVTIGKTFC